MNQGPNNLLQEHHMMINASFCRYLCTLASQELCAQYIHLETHPRNIELQVEGRGDVLVGLGCEHCS